MRLDALAAALDGAKAPDVPALEITNLAYDSRSVEPGALFFCVRGGELDGHDFADDAVKAGAVALVTEEELPELLVPQILVEDARAAMAPAASRFQGDPTSELKVAGITGTNGKTTTAFLLQAILELSEIQCGLLGTVKRRVAGVDEEMVRTTPEAIDLQEIFRQMVAGGDKACVMEVSSHSLALHRCDAIHFDVAVFTNLTQDHLDFHTDMEDYYRSKRLLFHRKPKISVVNIDDPYGRRLAREIDCETFSMEGRNADYEARNVRIDTDGARFTVNSFSRRSAPAIRGELSPAGKEEDVQTALPGRFNVANALGAFVAARALGVSARHAAVALAEASAPPGRFEPIDEGQPFAVLVDYAHTPDSLENVLRAAGEMTKGRVVAVFGAGGDRDRGKRPLMGRAGAEGSDLAIVTSDNPRSEDPAAIVAEVAAGAGAGGGGAVETEVDRRAAIALALARAEPGDTVVIAGKGHEQGQEFEDERKIPFDDREVAREELRRLLGGGQAPATASV